MASFDDTMTDFDFDDMDIFQNPLSSGTQLPPALNSPLALFESPDTQFYNEDDGALMEKYQPSHGSLSPSTNSCTSDDMPATPLSCGAETVELNQSEFYNQGYYDLLDQVEREGGASSGGHALVQAEQISNGSEPVQLTAYKVNTSSTQMAAPGVVAGEEQTQQTHMEKTINAVDMMSASPSSRRPTITVPRESSNARQDMNNVAKSDAVRVGVKRKTDQGKEKAKKVMKKCDDPTISRNKKNAIAARENRLKKKMEFEDLKRNEAFLEEENQSLRKENSDHLKTIQDLQQEVEYYKSVLFNQSALATVLQSLNPQPKVKLSSSVNVPNVDQSSMSGGVCLHVNGTDASLEWCAKCSIKAKASFNS